MKTTLKELKSWGTCGDGYDKVLKVLGTDYGDTTPIELLDIAKHKTSTVGDIFWLLNKFQLDKGLEKDLRLFSCDCAERVLPFFESIYPEDHRIRSCIEKTRAYILSDIERHAMIHARKAASVTSYDYASAASYAVAPYAPYADYASHAAAAYAAHAAVYGGVSGATYATDAAAYAAAAATDGDADIHCVVARGEERKTQKAQLIEIIAKY